MSSIRKCEEYENNYLVGSSKDDGTEYRVNLKEETCNCPAFVYNHHCKHLQLTKLIMNQEKALTDEEEEFLNSNVEFEFDVGAVVLGEKRIAELVYLGEIYIKKPGIYARLK